MRVRKLLLVVMVSVAFATPTLAQDYPRDRAAGLGDLSAQNENKRADKSRNENPSKSQLQGKVARSGNSLGMPLLRNLLQDQKAIWTSPSRLRFGDATWLVPLGGLTAGLLATDSNTGRHLSNAADRLNRSRRVSNYGVASLVGAAGGLYLWGKAAQDEHKREAGLLGAEALLNSLALNTVIQFAAGRKGPLEDNRGGRFWRGGRSFPSDHAAAAWSVAGVIVHEYPGPLTKLLAYGAASAVSASRVIGKKHFPSDVLIGSAIGWFIGQQVYSAHHDPELSGGSWETLSRTREGEFERHPGDMGSPYVSLDSWVYPAFERLAALGYIQTAFLGLRPWTRLECARLVEEAGDRLREEDSDPPEPARFYRALEQEFASELDVLGGSGNRRWRLESVYTRVMSVAGRPLRDGYHFGQTIVNDYGRPYAEGANVVTGVSGWATAGPFAVYVRGEYQHAPAAPALSQQVRNVIAAVDGTPLQPATPFPTANRFRLLDAYVAVNLRNWEVSFGKQSLWWGPGRGGPLIFSNNAEPVNMLRISRVVPFKMPSIFRWMGPVRVDAFFGQLSGHRFINTQFGRPVDPQPFIHGQKISFKPTPNLEFGVSRTAIYGGPGLPLTSDGLFRSFFSAGTAFGPHDPGDRRAGFDFSYRIPGLRKWLILYNDSLAEDEISPIGYPRRSAMNPGIYMPQIPGLPRVDFRIEGAYTDLPGLIPTGFYYWNVRYLDGYTNKGNLLGHLVGRQGRGIQLWSTYWLSPQSTVQAGYRHARVNPDFIPGGGRQDNISVRADLLVRSDLSLSSFLQYERWSFPLLSVGSKSNFTSSFQLTFWPRYRVRK